MTLHYIPLHQVSYEFLPPGWGVAGLLDDVATASPPFHTLIDSGALITGLTNVQAALCSTTLLFYYTTILLYYNYSTTLIFYCPTVLLYYCSTTLLY